jgi:hypothetical protein
MNPPAGPIRAELNDALVGGIRQRGPEAVGLVIVGLARLVVAVTALIVLLFASSVLGFNVTAGPFVVMSGLSGAISWLLTGGRLPDRKATIDQSEQENS